MGLFIKQTNKQGIPAKAYSVTSIKTITEVNIRHVSIKQSIVLEFRHEKDETRHNEVQQYNISCLKQIFNKRIR